MSVLAEVVRWSAVGMCPWIGLFAQDLAPRAYVVTPVHANAVTLTWSYFNGDLNLNGAVPITGATGTYSVPIVSLYHSFSFFGRSANLVGALPYAVGNFQGELSGTQLTVYRSGMVDTTFRVAVNLKGAPAMTVPEFVKWRQKVLLGASLKVVAPTGQYDSRKLVNWGINRWAFKPEFGYSQRWSNWVVDGFAGVWFYTPNNAPFSPSGPAQQTQTPVGSFEGHVSYDFGKSRLWASLDANFWAGGVASLNGIAKEATSQRSSRLGGTISIPFSKHQSIKLQYSRGTYVRFGGNYQNVSAAWQYSWMGRPWSH